MWLTILSDQLPIVAMVSRYLTIKLIGDGPLPKRLTPKGQPLTPKTGVSCAVCGISSDFSELSPTLGHVTHPLLTRSPLYSPPEGDFLARLACLNHAASVRSEPGSNPSWFEMAKGFLRCPKAAEVTCMFVNKTSLDVSTAFAKRKPLLPKKVAFRRRQDNETGEAFASPRLGIISNCQRA